jgi:hypothetical protein
MLRTSEMIFKYKKWKRNIDKLKEMKQKRDKDKKRSYKLRKTINLN